MTGVLTKDDIFAEKEREYHVTRKAEIAVM
jgi:hypothetical protein